MSTRLALVEDDLRYSTSLGGYLARNGEFALADSFRTAEEALAELERLRPARPAWDLVIMDLKLPGMDGVEATRRLKAELPDVAVVVLTVFEEPRTILEAICAGADGYLLKRSSPSELLAQLRVIVAGGAALTAGVARTVLTLLRQNARWSPVPRDLAPGTGLTAREQQVLECLVQGLAYKQVADHLGISIDTVRTHIRAIYQKLQVHSVAEAVSCAIRERLI